MLIKFVCLMAMWQDVSVQLYRSVLGADDRHTADQSLVKTRVSLIGTLMTNIMNISNLVISRSKPTSGRLLVGASGRLR
jgi:hypothetical protein